MSEVKVNKISPRTNCGTVTVGDSGDSVTVSAGVPVTVNGDLKSNALKATDGGSIISQSGTTITLGASGDTVSLASGASQTGFGRTGTVDWDTTPKTATFSAVSGDGFFCNTTSGAFTCNLPAGSAGAIVSLADYAATWDTNNLTVSPNGSDKIGGVSVDVALSTKGQSVTFVYVDSTQGWVNIQDSTSNVRGSEFMTATGGTVTCSGNYKIHTFTGPGTFTVCSTGAGDNNIVSYLVLAGGAAGGSHVGGGGGGGGFREYKGPADCYTASPLNGNPGGTAVTVTAQAYPITVGGGGTANTNNSGGAGNNSVFSTITSTGGGGGGGGFPGGRNGNSGGSGGGAGKNGGGTGGSGNTPPVSPAQGTDGGDSNPGYKTGGGGGATAAGSDGGNPGPAGPGGAGATTSINGTPVPRGGGGGGSSSGSDFGNGGSGGGTPGSNGTASDAGSNTGGGGGGAHPSGPNVGGNGGSGLVIIRYKYQ